VLSNVDQAKVLGDFRKGTINMLFSTAVAEEGLDVTGCWLVVCYDCPKRPLSQVQAAGRARAKDAQVIFMREAAATTQASSVKVGLLLAAGCLPSGTHACTLLDINHLQAQPACMTPACLQTARGTDSRCRRS
jgi:Helicase conserved C-terminal domain